MNKESIQDDFSWTEVPKAIWYFLAEDRKKFIYLSLVLFTVFFYELVPVYIVGKIVDFFTVYREGQSLSLFYFYVLFVGISLGIVGLMRNIIRNHLAVIAEKARTRMRILGFERLTEFSLEWHAKENTGNKLQRIFTGADAIVKWFKIFRADLLRILSSVAGVAFFFLFTDFNFLIIVAGYTALFLFIEFSFSKKLYSLSNQFNILNQKAGGVYFESASNMLAVKALGNEKNAVAGISNKETMSREISIQKVHTNNLKWRMINILTSVTLIVFLYFLGRGVISHSLTLGMILVLYTYFSQLSRCLVDVSNMHLDLVDLKSDLGNAMPIFRETEFIKTGNETFPKDWRKIEIKNASMDYGSGQMGLENFNLTLERNTKTGLAGLSGSGKSTIAKVILGLYALKSGEIKIGSKDYYSIAHNETLNYATVVLQETELFNLSLRDNITMMRSGDEELLNTAIDISELEEVIKRLPEGLDARIGEKGYMLSGGERQRLGIARAIYKNAPIIILDEATSSLDSETEGKIMEKLLGDYGKDKTFLIIAHRLGTLRYTDNIAVMERGKILEEGNYEKLMNDPLSAFYRLNREKKKDA